MLVNKGAVTIDQFWTSFSGMFFDGEKRANTEKAIRALKQTKSVVSYTYTFATHAYNSGWEVPTLISQYRQGLKQEVCMALVLARVTFGSLEEVTSLALQINNELNGAGGSHAIAAQPQADPNVMDLLAFCGQLSEIEELKMMKNGQCFQCTKRGHLVRDCPKKGKGKEAARISKLEEELKRLKGGKDTRGEGSKANKSKNCEAQE
ncbi:hypothetical protein Pst134EA_011864 [Puccinia striiformis f. sp. tritici]|uniref:hypothetical protein n=1 Tax=Puccinia striiformis f. sp. tritici TaxID=168172 RepID=UPI002007B3AC|nr:hypothetical protein Pst134EA_011864 [Puccinia striiformis f. sp. tritici]KAH9468238.1 hypothetical protein Pst134EA_011864 [Puccinia striiformis f. sp. tritici]